MGRLPFAWRHGLCEARLQKIRGEYRSCPSPGKVACCNPECRRIVCGKHKYNSFGNVRCRCGSEFVDEATTRRQISVSLAAPHDGAESASGAQAGASSGNPLSALPRASTADAPTPGGSGGKVAGGVASAVGDHRAGVQASPDLGSGATISDPYPCCGVMTYGEHRENVFLRMCANAALRVALEQSLAGAR
jgi:hypothetical protein